MTALPDFDALYREDPDPFRVGTRWYEQRKLGVVGACLLRSEYRLAWDPAAGTGHLARILSERCGCVIATDASQVAVDGMADMPENVHVARSCLPALPASAGAADLVVLSEVLYYLPDDARATTAGMLRRLDAEIVCVHWRHHPHDAPISGLAALEELGERLGEAFTRTVSHEEPEFVLASFVPANREEDR